MLKALPPARLLLIAKKISPRLTIPIVLAISMGVDRFSSLAEVYPMSSRTLAKAIANLEKEGIVTKRQDLSYLLTDKGKELAVHAKRVAEWAKKYYGLDI
jgi:DNA-binding HxlR family transcriptional regulator